MQNALFNLLDGFDLPGESASLTVRFRDARNESSPSSLSDLRIFTLIIEKRKAI
jgi:hypothetical protein